ncbi:MAG: sugar ABC transporter permease [candidate division WOR-3 bacterium]|jgi:multiple sugar transport system permease protein|nr:sugar ABC transporter permease [candidate division WOR-3 bacterium]MCR4423456.1 sugar ABC transporter permease [candidate division WOR-3 bacterium]MDH7518795.1 sugar ABC transporter permease [bacterium]
MATRPKYRNLLKALLYLAPALLILLVFRIFPIFLSIRMSLYDWGMAGPRAFVGLGNYIAVLKDPLFWKSLLNTGWYVLFEVPATLLLSLFIALLLNQRIRGLSIYRTIYYLPVVTSIVAVSVIWKWIFHPDRGVLNYLLSLIGITNIRWLQDPRGLFELIFGSAAAHWPYALRGPSVALCSLVLMGIWKALGYNIVIFLAGLQNIPQTYYEAARIDGASRFKTFWKITLPLLSPTTYYVLIMSSIAAFETFAQVWIMTGPPPGGPLHTTKVVMYYFYENAFELWRLGYGAAIAFIAFLIILGLTILQRVLLEKRVHYG